MQAADRLSSPSDLCHTLFFQGVGTSQTQVLKYVGNDKITATTGEIMWSTGCKSLLPIKVIYKPFIGIEVKDISLNVFRNFCSYLNPINIIGPAITWGANCYYGVHFTKPISPNYETVSYHVPNIFQMSIGQDIDMQTHRQKYDAWHRSPDRSKHLILYGVSRGTAATFCALAKEKYPEVKLVILEGAIDSVQNLLPQFVEKVVPIPSIAKKITSVVNTGLSFFKKCGVLQYDPYGPSPLKSVHDFPEAIPVVFITSKRDKIINCKNTERIARALADKEKNDVYLLQLEHSSHPNYMFDNKEDRQNYEAFLHAIYKKYNLFHEPLLAELGAPLLDQCLVRKSELMKVMAL